MRRLSSTALPGLFDTVVVTNTSTNVAPRRSGDGVVGGHK